VDDTDDRCKTEISVDETSKLVVTDSWSAECGQGDSRSGDNVVQNQIGSREHDQGTTVGLSDTAKLECGVLSDGGCHVADDVGSEINVRVEETVVDSKVFGGKELPGGGGKVG
jgi:hypothetical protein